MMSVGELMTALAEDQLVQETLFTPGALNNRLRSHSILGCMAKR